MLGQALSEPFDDTQKSIPKPANVSYKFIAIQSV